MRKLQHDGVNHHVVTSSSSQSASNSAPNGNNTNEKDMKKQEGTSSSTVPPGSCTTNREKDLCHCSARETEHHVQLHELSSVREHDAREHPANAATLVE